MTLVFGRLIQDFVTFGTALLNQQAAEQSGNATAISVTQQALNSAAVEFRHGAALDAAYLSYIGILFVSHTLRSSDVRAGLGMFVTTYLYMYFWTYTGETNAKRIREKYLEAILRQDVTFFDKVGAGEVATRIQTDTRKSSVSRSLVHCTQTKQILSSREYRRRSLSRSPS